MTGKAVNTYAEKPRQFFWLSVQPTCSGVPGDRAEQRRRPLAQSSAGTKEKPIF